MSAHLDTITIPVDRAGNHVATFPLESIKVGNRFRQDHGDLDALAASIKEVGLLQPIGVDRERNLMFGHRRLLAHQLLGLETIQARVIEVSSLLRAEHDENELRKGFTPSERVAIAEAIKTEIGNRQGQRTDRTEPVQNFAQVEPGQKTREAVAKAAGFGNAETYRQAKTVVEKADPALVQAMDAGEVSISTAAKLANAEPEVQREAVANPKAAPQIAKQVAVGKHEKLPFPDSAQRLPTPEIEDAEIINAPSGEDAEIASAVPTGGQQPEWKITALQRDATSYARSIAKALNILKGKEKDLDPKQRATLLGNLRAAIARLEATAEVKDERL